MKRFEIWLVQVVNNQFQVWTSLAAGDGAACTLISAVWDTSLAHSDPIYALDWSEPSLPRPCTSFRLAIGSFVEDFRNKISIIAFVVDSGPLSQHLSSMRQAPIPFGTQQDWIGHY